MTTFEIRLRGKQELPIKPVKNIPGDGGKGGASLHFPCLSIHILRDGEDGKTGYDCITWSNYHDRPLKDANKKITRDYGAPEYYNKPKGCQYSENPGSFNIKRIEMIPTMIYDKDTSNNRTVIRKTAKAQGGIKAIDFIEMSKQYGSTQDIRGNWTFGERQPFERSEGREWPTGVLANMETELIKRYGDALGIQILELFVTHELFQKYDSNADTGLKQAA